MAYGQEEEWRGRLTMLLEVGHGSTEDVALRFPCALPAWHRITEVSSALEAERFVLRFNLQHPDGAALVAELVGRLEARGYGFSKSGAGFGGGHDEDPFGANVELEAVPAGVRVVWSMHESQMLWVLQAVGSYRAKLH